MVFFFFVPRSVRGSPSSTQELEREKAVCRELPDRFGGRVFFGGLPLQMIRFDGSDTSHSQASVWMVFYAKTLVNHGDFFNYQSLNWDKLRRGFDRCHQQRSRDQEIKPPIPFSNPMILNPPNLNRLMFSHLVIPRIPKSKNVIIPLMEEILHHLVYIKPCK